MLSGVYDTIEIFIAGGSGSDVAARKLDQEASWQTITEY
jgi:hypothetical protein